LPIAYTVDRVHNIINEAWTGTVTAGELAAYWRTYLTDPEVMRCRRTLVDLLDAHIAFTGAELATLIEAIARPAIQNRTWATAILVSAPVAYGVSRQYQVFSEQYSRDAIFTDRDAALAWLVAQNPDAVR